MRKLPRSFRKFCQPNTSIAKRDQQDDHAIDDLDEAALGPAHALGDLGQVEMVDAARGGRHADEHAPGEEARGDQLQPQPGRAELARHDVEEDRKREPGDGDAAEHHQDMLQRVQRLPFQMAMALDDERRLGQVLRQPRDASHGRRRFRATARTTSRDRLLHVADEFRIFTACGPSSLASWSWIGVARP